MEDLQKTLYFKIKKRGLNNWEFLKDFKKGESRILSHKILDFSLLSVEFLDKEQTKLKVDTKMIWTLEQVSFDDCLHYGFQFNTTPRLYYEEYHSLGHHISEILLTGFSCIASLASARTRKKELPYEVSKIKPHKTFLLVVDIIVDREARLPEAKSTIQLSKKELTVYRTAYSKKMYLTIADIAKISDLPENDERIDSYIADKKCYSLSAKKYIPAIPLDLGIQFWKDEANSGHKQSKEAITSLITWKEKPTEFIDLDLELRLDHQAPVEGELNIFDLFGERDKEEEEVVY
ncbi:MAG: hypothetical protein F6K50_05660 [Moorea sp. SIO3I7]|nr:hypothetical protein [Moorena sp. SIO3I7]